jgi:MFS transporter, DHA2 family, multidrug resistance protein
VYVPSAAAALICTALVYRLAPSVDKPQRDLRPDVPGLLLMMLSFGSLQYLANEAERRNWFDDGTVTAAVVLLVVAAIGFVLWELYLARAPLINLRILAQKRNLAVGSGMNLILGAVGYSVVTFTLYLQQTDYATATLAGAMILLRLAAYIPGVVLAFVLVRRRILGIRAVVTITAIGSALGLLGFAANMTSTADAGTFVSITLLFGLAFAMLSQPVPAVVLGTLGLNDIGAGLSLYKVSALLGLSIGTAIIQTLLDHNAAVHSADLAGFVNGASYPVTRYLAGGGNLKALATLVSGQAQALALADVMRVYAVWVLLTIPLIVFADTKSPAPPPQK